MVSSHADYLDRVDVVLFYLKLGGIGFVSELLPFEAPAGGTCINPRKGVFNSLKGPCRKIDPFVCLSVKRTR